MKNENSAPTPDSGGDCRNPRPAPRLHSDTVLGAAVVLLHAAVILSLLWRLPQ